MALDYITANTGLFNRLGKIIKSIDDHAADATTLDAELKAIADKFEAADLAPQILGLYGDYAAFKDAIAQHRQQRSVYSDSIFTDRDTVLEELNLTDGDVTTVMAELFRRMVADSQTVNASVVTIGPVTADGTNIGNGVVLLTKLLDGVTPPVAGGPSILQYAGRNSELAVPLETMTWTCTRDSGGGGLEGSEQFNWTGEEPDVVFGWQNEGSGAGPQLTVAGGATIIQNGDFENFTGTVPTSVPNSWTVDAGAALVDKELSVIYRNLGALKFAADGVATSIAISQQPSGMVPRRTYIVSLMMRASVSAPAAGTYEVLFTATGYTASATEKVSIAPGAITNTYTRYTFVVVTPAALPSDWKLNVRVTGTPTAGVTFYTDDLTVQEATYHGGVGAVIVPGSIPFRVGDRFIMGLTNTEGIIQRFFRRRYLMQLPSDNAGAETILDSLAT